MFISRKTAQSMAMWLGAVFFVVSSGTSEAAKLKSCSKWRSVWNNCIADITLKDGSRYFGSFYGNKFNGMGTFYYPNGDVYEGEFKDDAFQGNGRFRMRDGSVYEGQFSENRWEGNGSLKLSNGKSYVGEFKDNKPNGKGIFRYPDGMTYEGEFVDGKNNGEGTLTFPDGRRQVGSWKNGAPSGKSTLYAADGSILERGIYEKGNLVKSTLGEEEGTRAKGKGKRVKMVQQNGVYVVPIRLNDELTLKFVVDSGAADVSLPADVVSALVRTGSLAEGDFIGRQSYRLADGSVIESSQFRLRKMTLGNVTVDNVTASISNTKGALLLGQSFLERFSSWSIDNKTHELVLE